MRSRENTRLGPGITSEAVLEILEYVRMPYLEAVVLVCPVGGVLAEPVVGPWEYRAVLPYLRVLL